MAELFQGVISKTHITRDKKSHIADFNIDEEKFRFKSGKDDDYVFEDGDKVALFAERTNKGYHEVKAVRNFTRKFQGDNEPLWLYIVFAILFAAVPFNIIKDTYIYDFELKHILVTIIFSILSLGLCYVIYEFYHNQNKLENLPEF